MADSTSSSLSRRTCVRTINTPTAGSTISYTASSKDWPTAAQRLARRLACLHVQLRPDRADQSRPCLELEVAAAQLPPAVPSKGMRARSTRRRSRPPYPCRSHGRRDQISCPLHHPTKQRRSERRHGCGDLSGKSGTSNCCTIASLREE